MIAVWFGTATHLEDSLYTFGILLASVYGTHKKHVSYEEGFGGDTHIAVFVI